MNRSNHSVFGNNIPHVWAAFVPPKDDELLTSWLTRIAHSHHHKVYSFYKLNAPNIHIWNRDIDKSAKEDFLYLLSSKTNTTYKRVEGTTLKKYSGKLFNSGHFYSDWPLVLPAGVYHRKRKRYSLQYCPSCLRKDGLAPYYRTKWRLAISFVCPSCKIYLKDSCPYCNEPIVFFRNELGRKEESPHGTISLCSFCNRDIALERGIIASEEAIKIQDFIYTSLSQPFIPHITTYEFFVGFRQIIKILSSIRPNADKFKIALSNEFGIPKIGAHNLVQKFEFMRILERTPIIIQAAKAFENWPHLLKRVIKNSGCRQSLFKIDNIEFKIGSEWFLNELILIKS